MPIYEQAYGPDHPDVARSLNNLGKAWYQFEELRQPGTASQDREAAVFDAIRDHKVGRVADLLQQDRRLLEKVMARDNGHGALRERTPLMYAAQLGDTAMVSLLVEHRAWVNLAQREGATPPSLSLPKTAIRRWSSTWSATRLTSIRPTRRTLPRS